MAQVGAKHGPFDCILCLDVLEHLVDPWRVVGALHGQLAPGGVIVASIPNVQHHSVVRALMTGGWRYDPEGGLLDETHLRFFTRSTAIELMTSSGLRLDAVDWTGLGPGGKSGLIDRMTFGTLRGFLVYQYLIRVKRS
ncbi:MAG: methyltransferase domain-containing protein [Alphaproteobacteria bacterium]